MAPFHRNRWRRIAGWWLIGALLAAGALLLKPDPTPLALDAAPATLAIGTPAPVDQPTIGGDLRLGGLATCGRGAWNDEPGARYALSWAWTRDGALIAGAGARQHIVEAGDFGHTLGCVVTAASADGQTGTTSNSVSITARPLSGPATTGDPRVGGTVTCSRGSWFELPGHPLSISFQWRRNDVNIAGATSASYKLVQADLGKTVNCVAIAPGSTEYSGEHLQILPRPLLAPVVTGDARMGGTLSCSRGTWDDRGDAPYAVTYRWTRDDSAIPGANAATYLVNRADLGHYLRCVVSASGLVEQLSSAIDVRARLRDQPALTGDPRLGGTLTCGRGIWDERADAVYDTGYRWLRDQTPLPDETGTTHVVTEDDLGHAIACRVAAAGQSSADSPSVMPAVIGRAAPSITGDPRLGGTITCSRGLWDERADTPYATTTQWYRDGATLDGTAATHVIVAADLGAQLTCGVIAQQMVRMISTGLSIHTRNVTPPTIAGTPAVGEALTCSDGTWDERGDTPYDLSRQWLRDGQPIPGATSATYTPVSDDADRMLSCSIVAEGDAGASAAGVTIRATVPTHSAGSDPVSLAVPMISGDTRLGGVLTCSRGIWDDGGGAPYAVTYRWFRDYPYSGSAPDPIETAATHTVITADLGRDLYCEVRAGASRALGQVSVAAPATLSDPLITGDPRYAGTLTCGRGVWNDAPSQPYGVTYRWYREYPFSGSAPDPVATGPTFTVTDQDVGQTLYCVVTAEGSWRALAQITLPRPQFRLFPQITGDHRLGQTLTCGRGTWDDDPGPAYPITYRWYRDYPYSDSAPDPIGTTATHVIVADDLGRTIYCVVQPPGGPASAALVSVSVGTPQAIIQPELTGEARLGKTLTCGRGDWDDEPDARYPVTYTWYRDYPFSGDQPAPIDTGTTHVVVGDDLGRTLYCEVAAPGGGYALPTLSVPGPRVISNPVIDGQPSAGIPLTCSRGAWDDTDLATAYHVTYAWHRDEPWAEAIDGATDATYTPTAADVSHEIYCVVTAEGTGTGTAGVYINVPQSLNAPRIAGDARAGQRLRCSRGDWDDDAGARYPVSFAWFRDAPYGAPPGPPIQLSDTYVPLPEDVGHQLTCLVTAANAAGAWTQPVIVDEPLVATTASVSDAAPVPGQPLTITLQVHNPRSSAIHLRSLTYVPFAGGTFIAGSVTGSMTTDPSADGDGRLRFELDRDVDPGGDVALSFMVTAPGVAGVATDDLVTTVDDAPADRAEPNRVVVAAADTTACTITGTPGDDVLSGTAGNDVICGLGGDDVLLGNGGSDRLLGGPGADRLEGGAGDDVLDGGADDDVLHGDDGADALHGGSGRDLASYADRDAGVTVTIGSGAADDGAIGEHDDVAADIERVRGGNGDDVLTGGAADEELSGLGGSDRIDGGDGIDDLDGGAGNDTILSEDANSELLDCGGGTDTYAADPTDRLVGCETPR